MPEWYLYVLSIALFAVPAVLVEWIFGYHLVRRFWKAVLVTTVFFLVLTPNEFFALKWGVWLYNPDTTLTQRFLGAEIETYLFSLFVSIAIASAVVVWTTYEDEGKSIIRQSLKDMIHLRYALWRRKSGVGLQ